jgi:hypothetical protein
LTEKPQFRFRMKSTPSAKKILVNSRVLSEALGGVTERYVRDLEKKGIVKKTGRGVYDLVVSTAGYIIWRNSQEDESEDSFKAQRTRVYRARAEILEAQSQAMRGELHDAACITEVVGEGLANLRAKMLAIPNTAGPRVADESDPNKCAAMIETLIHEALAECSRYNGREVVNRYLKRNESKQEEEETGEGWET